MNSRLPLRFATLTPQKKTVNESVNKLISNGGDCRTAPATPGLLKSLSRRTSLLSIVVELPPEGSAIKATTPSSY